MVAHAVHGRRPQTPGLAQGSAQDVVRDAERILFKRAERAVIRRFRCPQGAVAGGRVAKQQRLAALLEQTGGVRCPGVKAEGLTEYAHQLAPCCSPLPQEVQFRGLGKRSPKPVLQGQAADLAHAQVGDGLPDSLDPTRQTEQRGVDGSQQRRCQRHVGFDQLAQFIQVARGLSQKRSHAHQGRRRRRQFQIQRKSSGLHGLRCHASHQAAVGPTSY